MARKILKLNSSLFLFTFFAYCLLPFALCFAQMSSPDVKCISVSASGDVTLTWIIPPPGSFVSYHIDTSSSPATIPFATYTTISTYTATTFTHTGANANIRRMYYLVYTESAGPVFSTPTDTFSTIYLTVTNFVSSAKLDWNSIASPNVSTSTGWYKIYREYPVGNWVLRDSTTALTYTDVIDVCNDSLSYRIEIADNTGCTSVSNAAGGIFSDNTPPVVSPIDTVSVNAANLATISWNSSPSPDADSVVIYRSLSSAGPWIPIATVPVSQTSYTNTLSTAASASEYYRVAFMDSCRNISPMVTAHKTIYLSATFDVCAATASLVWNKYINWTPSVTQYDVYVSVNGGNFSYLASTAAFDTNYVHTNLSLGNNYCYLIRATNGTKTSSSNRICGTLNVSQPPLFNYARYATVLSDKSIQITAHVDPAPGAKYFRIQRAERLSGNFSIIATNLIPPPGNTLTYTDNTVNVAANSYVYKVEAIDSCGNVIIASNSDTTILLQASIEPNLQITLSWNDYGSFLGSTSSYKIYRAVDGVWGTTPIATIPYSGNGGTYTDDVSLFFTNSRGNFSYYIMAIEGSGNTFGFTDSSRSNIVKILEYPQIYVPNCFTPNGDLINDEFIPVVGFVDPSNYSLAIYDNTGTPVFSTENPAEGWDGKKKGHPCPIGVYVYVISTQASGGNNSRISGTVTLLR
jgi:gliding motility-associated-like protein